MQKVICIWLRTRYTVELHCNDHRRDQRRVAVVVWARLVAIRTISFASEKVVVISRWSLSEVPLTIHAPACRLRILLNYVFRDPGGILWTIGHSVLKEVILLSQISLKSSKFDFTLRFILICILKKRELRIQLSVVLTEVLSGTFSRWYPLEAVLTGNGKPWDRFGQRNWANQIKQT